MVNITDYQKLFWGFCLSPIFLFICQELDQLKSDHSQLSEESSKIREEKSELEKKLLRSNNILQSAKTKLQQYKESNDKLTVENTELKEKTVTAGASSSGKWNHSVNYLEKDNGR